MNAENCFDEKTRCKEMEVYETSWDGMSEVQTDVVLVVEDNGRFSYDENWYCYGGGGATARGVWWQDGGGHSFRCDYSEKYLSFNWTLGETKKAVKTNDSIDFGGNFTMSLRRGENTQAVEPSKESERLDANIQLVKAPDKTAAKNSAESSEKKSQPTIAKLYFKDGSVQERPLPNNSMFDLFTQNFTDWLTMPETRLMFSSFEQTTKIKIC